MFGRCRAFKQLCKAMRAKTAMQGRRILLLLALGSQIAWMLPAAPTPCPNLKVASV